MWLPDAHQFSQWTLDKHSIVVRIRARALTRVSSPNVYRNIPNELTMIYIFQIYLCTVDGYASERMSMYSGGGV